MEAKHFVPIYFFIEDYIDIIYIIKLINKFFIK